MAEQVAVITILALAAAAELLRSVQVRLLQRELMAELDQLLALRDHRLHTRAAVAVVVVLLDLQLQANAASAVLAVVVTAVRLLKMV
jgi:hypothetical protein